MEETRLRLLQVLRWFCASAIHYTPHLSFSAAQATIVVAQAAVTTATLNLASVKAEQIQVRSLMSPTDYLIFPHPFRVTFFTSVA